MPRSVAKGPFIDARLFKRIEQMNAGGEKKILKTWSRRSTIVPEMIGHTLAIHNGKKFIPKRYCGMCGCRRGKPVLWWI